MSSEIPIDFTEEIDESDLYDEVEDDGDDGDDGDGAEEDEPTTVDFAQSAFTIGGDLLRIRRNSARGRYD